MSLQLWCTDGKGNNNTVALSPAKPLKVRCRDGDGTIVIVHFTINAAGDQCQVAVQGEGHFELNQQRQREAGITQADQVHIGRHRFQLETVSSETDRAMSALPNAAHLHMPCSSCQKPFTEADCRQAWMDAGFRICLVCLDKGVRPQHLSAWRHSLEVDVHNDATTDELHPHASAGRDTAAIHPQDIHDAMPTEALSSSAHSEATQAYARNQRPQSQQSSQPLPLASDQSGRRHRRRLSASSESAIEPPPEPGSGRGLIGKVTRVFRRRGSEEAGGERDRLELLEDERAQLLQEVGRLSLHQQGGLGLPRDLLARLGGGETVVLSLADCDRPTLEAWRERQRQLAHLDAEIAAIRQALGMTSDPALKTPQVTLRTEAREQENRAFLASDTLLTEDLSGMEADLMAVDDDDTEAYKRGTPDASRPAEAAESEADKKSSGPRSSARSSGKAPGHSARRNLGRRRRR